SICIFVIKVGTLKIFFTDKNWNCL
ncbi:uncharacterized protein METZ01_LOCUS359889, partial [marine metagenome]